MDRKMDVKKTIAIQGMKLYTCRGDKCLGDERLYITTLRDGKEGSIIPLCVSHIAYMVDHIYKIEELRYPRSVGFGGGEVLMSCLRMAGEDDWETALVEHGLRVPRGVIRGY